MRTRSSVLSFGDADVVARYQALVLLNYIVILVSLPTLCTFALLPDVETVLHRDPDDLVHHDRSMAIDNAHIRRRVHRPAPSRRQIMVCSILYDCIEQLLTVLQVRSVVS